MPHLVRICFLAVLVCLGVAPAFHNAVAADEFAGPSISKDALYAMELSGLTLGMTPAKAQEILEEKGFEGKFNFTDGRMMNGDQTADTGSGTFKNPIDKITLYLQSYQDPETQESHLYSISFKQKFSTPQDADTWKEKVKQRYGDTPTREEEFRLFYSAIPMAGTHVAQAKCNMAGRGSAFPSRELCYDLSSDPRQALKFSTDYDNEISLMLIDRLAAKDATKRLKDGAKKQTEENSKNQDVMF